MLQGPFDAPMVVRPHGGPSPAGARDGALLALPHAGGLRRSVAVALDLADDEPDSGRPTIRAHKGRKDRLTCATTWLRSLAGLCASGCVRCTRGLDARGEREALKGG